MWACEWMVIGKWQECSSSALVLHLSAAHLTLIESVCRWTKHPHWPLAYPLLFLDHTSGRLLFSLQSPDPCSPKPAQAQKHWDVPPSPNIPMIGTLASLGFLLTCHLPGHSKKTSVPFCCCVILHSLILHSNLSACFFIVHILH